VRYLLFGTYKQIESIPMKIYFTGAHSSGKTTCARYVSEKYKLPIVTEVARMVLSEQELQLDSLRYDMDLVDSYQSQVFYRQMVEEAKYDSFVSDRSAIDCLAYSTQHTRILPNLLASPELKAYLPILRAPDTFILFVKPSKATLRADGTREAINWEGVIAIDAQIKLFYEMFNLRYFQINTDSMQERVRLIDSILSLSRM
jgi:nicotinamide riboside kinase